MLGQLESGQRVVIADMEAGLGTLVRMGEESLDLILLVANPSEKSIEVVRRAREIIAERKIAPVSIVVANRLRDDADLDLLRAALDEGDVIAVPEDPAIRAADFQGVSPIDLEPSSPGVGAIRAATARWEVS